MIDQNELPEIAVVMPVYNEQASVRKVVNEWFEEMENWTEKFIFLAIDDGSVDQTKKILDSLSQRLGRRLIVISRENRGHGQSCLDGYRWATERNIPWVLQIDSDGQCDPQYFFRFWRIRERYHVIYGARVKRDDGWRRVLASFVLKLTIFIHSRAWCVDANVPYRMMRGSELARKVDLIPNDFFLANVALAILFRKDPDLQHGKVAIRFRERYGGEPSVPLTNFGSKATQLVRQIKQLQNPRV